MQVQSGEGSSEQSSDGQQPTQPQQGQSPPQEAVDACADLSEGNSCSFNPQQSTVTGVCRVTPTNQLACIPEGSPPPDGKP